MPNELPPDDLRTLWQCQKNEEPVIMSLDELRTRADRYRRKIRTRNAIEYIALLAVSIFFAFTAAQHSEPLVRAGSGLCIAGGIYVAWQLHRRASVKSMPADLALAPCIEFQRRELERQCDFHRNIWRWYLGPLLPGLAVLVLAGAVADQGRTRYGRLFLVSYSVVCALSFYMVGRWNRHLARKVQGRIDELDAAMRQSS